MKTIKMSGIPMAALALAAFFITGCGGGGGGGGSRANLAAQTAAAYMAGRVVTMNNAALGGATVVVNGGEKTITVKPDGTFSLEMDPAALNSGPVRLKISKNGYVEKYVSVRFDQEQGWNGIYSAVFKMNSLPATAKESTRAEIIRGDGSRETVAPKIISDPQTGLTVAVTSVTIGEDDRAVVFSSPGEDSEAPAAVGFRLGSADGNGSSASEVLGMTGTITGSISYGDPTVPEALETFPGEFYTESDTGYGSGGGPLVTAGFTTITLTDGNGKPITKFADGATALVTMRVPEGVQNPETGMLVSMGDTIPVFVFSESSGEWIVEHNEDGSVKRTTVRGDSDGLYVEFEVSHLSTFNLDWKSESCPSGVPRITLRNVDGSAVKNANVYARMPGWTKNIITAGQVVSFYRAPADTDWTVWAEKDGVLSDVVTIHNCVAAGTGRNEIDLFIGDCDAACDGDSGCDDGISTTRDSCINPGACNAACSNIPCNVVCMSDAECADSDARTTDTCAAPATCDSSCTHQVCSISCISDSECDDGNQDTLDICGTTGTCDKSCFNQEVFCELSLDRVNYEPGETMSITLTATNRGTSPVNCGVASGLKRDNSERVWDSFDDDLYITIYPGEETTRSITKVIPEAWVSTDSLQGSDYTLYTVRDSGAQWSGGDNFNIHVNRTCAKACGADSDCDDSNAFTVNSCVNEGTCAATCFFGICAVGCNSDAGCDDGNPLTDDSCADPGMCGSACINTPCSASCSNDAQCDDMAASTYDICNLPGTCDSECGHSPCDIDCAADSDCNDNVSATLDHCAYPGTCQASCANTACSITCGSDSDCDDGNSLTSDTCGNPGTCASSCSNTSCAPACRSNAQCYDGDLLTNDTCVNPNSCDAYCDNHSCVACNTNADCDDSDPLTTDYCRQGGTCVSSCYYYQCEAACSADSDCDDGNLLTTDACLNPDSCAAECTNTRCASCMDDGECDDGDPLTRNTCTALGVCEAECRTEICTPACLGHEDCGENQYCYNPNTCISECVDFITGTWELLSANANDISDSAKYHDNSMDLDSAGNPIIVRGSDPYSTNISAVFVKAWNGELWEEMGKGSAHGYGIAERNRHGSGRDIAVDGQDNVYVVWSSGVASPQGPQNIFIKKWDGSVWSEVGTGSASGYGISGNTAPPPAYVRSSGIEIDKSGAPVVSWVTRDGSFIKRWNSASWEPVGDNASAVIPGTGPANYTDMTIAPNGNIYLSWASEKVRVISYDGNSWQLLGEDGIPGTTAVYQFAKLSFDENGNPIVIWAQENRIYVSRWNGSGWTEMGEGSLPPGQGLGSYNESRSSYPSIIPVVAITSDLSGKPTVAWINRRVNGDSDIYMKKWDGSHWVEIGVESASGAGISSSGIVDGKIILKSDPDGNPVILYHAKHWYSHYFIYVKRFVPN